MPQNKGRFLRLPTDVHAFLDECMRQRAAATDPVMAAKLLPSRVVADAVRRSQMYQMWKQTQKPVQS